jgi:short-subunit dehydrogenase
MGGLEIAGSRVLLTGASSGIGRELARELGARGARLAIGARRAERLESLADEIEAAGGERPAALPADLAQRGEADRLADGATAALGGVDVLVNNAGGGVGGRIATLGDRDEAREAFEVNYWSPLALIRALAPGMEERGTGAIVNVSSLAHVSTWPGFGAYAATKGALATATETLALELVDSPVHTMHVLPGPIDTAVQGETRLAPGIDRMLGRAPMGDAGEMARRIVRGLERGSTRVVYPSRARMADRFPGLIRWDSRRLAARAARDLDPAAREALAGLVVRTGSQGDDLARHAREEWERSRGRPA